MEMESELKDALNLSAEEAKVYNNLLQNAALLPRSDIRFTLVISFTWLLLRRRRRLEQQRIRRKQFYRRWRRILLLHNHFKRRNSLSIHSDEEEDDDELMLTQEAIEPVTPLRIRHRQRFTFNKEATKFWLQIANNEMDEEMFQQYFHMSKDTFEFLYNELREHLSKSNTSMREALPGKKRLAVTLFRIANNAEYLKVSNLFSIGKSTTTSLVRDVCEIIVAQLKSKFLDWFIETETETKYFNATAKEEAETIFKIPNCYGVLGSIDVFTVGSSWNYADLSPCKSSFYNGQHALAFQTVVNYMGLFCHMATPPQPSGLTNTEIFQNSGLENELIEYDKNEKKCEDLKIGDVRIPKVVLLADKSYSSSSYVVTPYSPLEICEGEKRKRKTFNSTMEESFSVFDQAVFKLKKRWKIFHGKNGKINFNTDTFENIALACCILHNVCELRGDLAWSGSDDPTTKATDELLKEELFKRSFMGFEVQDEDFTMEGIDSSQGKILREALASYLVNQ